MTKQNLLTNLKVKNATCPKGKLHQDYADGGNLFFRIYADGRRNWLVRLYRDNKEHARGVGSYPTVSLLQARQIRDDYKVMWAKGLDPKTEKVIASLRVLRTVSHYVMLLPEITFKSLRVIRLVFMGLDIYIYRLFKKKVDSLIYLLFRKKILWLGLPLSIIARKFFFREFFPNKKSYSSLGELNKMVEDRLEKHSANAPLNHLKDQGEFKPSSVLNKKVLFVFSPNVKNSKKNIAGNGMYWFNSAKHAGCKVDKFDSSKISYHKSDFEVSKSDRIKILEAETEKLLIKISKFQPDLIFIDINYVFSVGTINSKTIQKIKSITSARITGHADDMVSEASFASMELWANFMDICIFSNPGWANRAVRNIFYVPYTVDPYSFYPAKKKGGNLFFSGIGNIPRYGYLFVAKRYCKKNNIAHYVETHKREKKFSLSRVRFEKYIRESNAVLELTARSSKIRVTGGRTYNSLACKTLLIIERTDELHHLLEPFTHYIPFNTNKELEIAIQFSNESTKLVNKITNNSYKIYNRVWHGDKVWPQIFEFSFNKKIINKTLIERIN